MSVQLIRKDKNSKSNWSRMLKANDLLWDLYKPDASLKAGKGWLIHTLDALHICEAFDKNNISYKKITEHIIEIA